MDEDCVVRVGVVGGGVSGVDAYVHDFDVLVLEKNVVVGFEVDLQRVPTRNEGTTWTLRHGCCYMGKITFLPLVISNSYAWQKEHTRQLLRDASHDILQAA